MVTKPSAPVGFGVTIEGKRVTATIQKKSNPERLLLFVRCSTYQCLDKLILLEETIGAMLA